MASSSQAASAGTPGGGSARSGSRRRPPLSTNQWTWWDEVHHDGLVAGGGSRPWRCKICPYKRTGGADKVRAHFFHEPGHEVRFCKNITPEKRQELLARLAINDATEQARKSVAVDPYQMVRPSRVARAPQASVEESAAGFSASALGSSSSQIQPPNSQRRQSTLPAHWNAHLKEEVDRAVARCFFHDHISFNVARSEYFKAMVHKIGEYGPSYVPPSSESLRTTLLEKEKRVVEQAAEIAKKQWERNGVSLIADGWSDTQKRSIHGVVAYSRGEMYFVTSHDASGTGKSADVLASEWSTSIEVIGPELVVGFVVDGEASNRAAGVIIERMYPHITVSFCMAHCLNNLLKDIGALPWVAPIIDEASKMVSFILNHQHIRHEFQQRSTHSLLKYSETRFAYNFLMLGRVHKCSGALRGLFLSDEFAALSDSRSDMGRECMLRAENGAWWERVKMLDHMVQPIMHLLRVVDGMQPCIGKVYEAMDTMLEKLQEMGLDDDQYEDINALCMQRWNSYYSPLHAAAYVLDPEFQGNKQETDTEVSAGWRIILDRLVPDSSMRRTIRDQLSRYRSFQGTYGCPDAQEDRFKVGAALWWEDFGSDGPELQALAIRILSQAVSTSCLERLWSTYSHIASKKRNRLGVARANDLVYVSANLRMLAQNATKQADMFTEWETAIEEEE